MIDNIPFIKEAKEAIKRTLNGLEISDEVTLILAQIYFEGKKAGLDDARKILKEEE